MVRCSTPLHLPSALEFSLGGETDSNPSEESSSVEDDTLFDGSNMTVSNFQQLYIDFVVRHKVTDNASKELLKIFKRVLPTPNNIPHQVGHRRTKVTREGFEVADVRKQLSSLVERNLDVLVRENTLTLFMNTDGATPFKSSKQSFWPFWAFVDNLPSPRRTAFKNMVLVALWKGNVRFLQSDFSSVHKGSEKL